MTSVRKKRKAFVEQSDCVACGCCVKVCPLGAIQIIKGVMAQVEWRNASDVENVRKNVRQA